MTGPEFRQARAVIGARHGLGRPLRAAEMARLLKLRGTNAGATVLGWETGVEVSGPVSVAVELMIAGGKPAHWGEAVG